MTSQPHSVHPPLAAVWFVELFTPDDQRESILGDLLEEFSAMASREGIAVARRWYWRQTSKTISHLIVSGFYAAPLATAIAVTAGFLLLWSGARFPEKIIVEVLRRYPIHPNYDHENVRDLWMFWVPNAILIGSFIQSMLIGGAVAIAVKGKEMVTSIVLVLVLCGMTGAAWIPLLARGITPPPGIVLLNVADWFAIVAGAVIVRTHRLRTATRPSAT
jgi:hypothetical protein